MQKIWAYCIAKLVSHRWHFLFWLFAITGIMGYFASRVGLDYSYTKALPESDPFYIEFQEQRKEFGADANVIFIGIKYPNEMSKNLFYDFVDLHQALEKVDGVKNAWSLHDIVRLIKDTTAGVQRFIMDRFIPSSRPSELELQEGIKKYLEQPLFKNLFFNPYSHNISIILTVDAKVMESPNRTYVANTIKSLAEEFRSIRPETEVFISGMPFIRVEMATKIKQEMILLIVMSLIVSLIILYWCFRSLHILVVCFIIILTGIVWCFGITNLFGYNLTLLNSLAPTLVVIIGIPNCIYIINYYVSTYERTQNQKRSIVYAIDKMGFITFFCNLIAAIGFYAFAFTKSPILIEFGLVAGTSVLCLFPIALIIILGYLSLARPPKVQIKSNRNAVDYFVRWVRSLSYGFISTPISTLIGSAVLIGFLSLGIGYIQSNSYVFDGIPKKDKLFTDLQYFERELKGVYNIDVFVESKRPITRDLGLLAQIDQFSTYVKSKNHTSDFCLSITDGIKFLRQSFYENDMTQFAFPNLMDFSFMYPYIKNTIRSSDNITQSVDDNLLRQFISKDEKKCKLSFFVSNIGSNEIRIWKEDVQRAADSLLTSSHISVKIGGSGVIFIQGNQYIMDGLLDSIITSFILISICILLVFRNVKYLFISIIPNIIPLVVMLGLLGWLEIEIGPATVIIFGIAFGIANDLTLRIMIAYAYDLKQRHWQKTFVSSVPSVVFTALALIFGFSVFCVSDMNNVFYIGFFMSIAMILATFCNIIILPILLKILENKKGRDRHPRPL